MCMFVLGHQWFGDIILCSAGSAGVTVISVSTLLYACQVRFDALGFTFSWLGGSMACEDLLAVHRLNQRPGLESVLAIFEKGTASVHLVMFGCCGL